MNICLKWISNEQNDINILDLDIVVGERESVCVCVCVCVWGGGGGGGGGKDYGVISTFWLFRNNSIIFKLQFAFSIIIVSSDCFARICGADDENRK